MTRSEFDYQIRELKNKKGEAIREIAALQSEIKEEISSKYRQIDEIRKEISKLNQSLQGYPHGSICLEVPYFDNVTGCFTKERGSMVYNICYSQAIRVLKAHVKQLKRELAALQPKED